MGSMSIWHWIIMLLYIGMIVAYFVALVRILNRMGYSGWWALLTFVPIRNIIGLWSLSKARWPGMDAKKIADTF